MGQVVHRISNMTGWAHVFDHSSGPGPPPPTPNPNDAANAAQQTTDALRARRGILSNIVGGATNQQPIAGKTTLGT